MTCAVRTATPADATPVLSLWQRAEAAASTTDDITSIERAARLGTLFVATDGGKIIGSLVAAFDGWRGNMYRLAVDPAHRRNGVASALVATGEQRLRNQGCVRITALVLEDEDHAVGFWRAAGYELHVGMARYTKTSGPGT